MKNTIYLQHLISGRSGQYWAYKFEGYGDYRMITPIAQGYSFENIKKKVRRHVRETASHMALQPEYKD